MNILRQIRALFLRFAPAGGRWLPGIGGACLVVAGVFAAHSWLYARSQQKAMATVTDNVSAFAPAGGVRFSPRLRFRAGSGALVMVQTSDRSDEVEFAAGETLPVLYPAGRPERAIIATPWRAYRGAIVFGVLGVVLFDVGLILRLVLRVSAARAGYAVR